MTKADTLKIVAPELAHYSEDTINFWINRAEAVIDEDEAGDNYEYACVLQAAHYMTLSARGGIGGQITAESEGDLSRSYDVASTTSYLQMLACIGLRSNVNVS